MVYPPFFRLHHSFPAKSDSIPPTESDTRLDAVHDDEPDNGLELKYREVLVFWMLISDGRAVGVM